MSRCNFIINWLLSLADDNGKKVAIDVTGLQFIQLKVEKRMIKKERKKHRKIYCKRCGVHVHVK